MRKIAISLSKGGVGKTTTAVNLAAGLSEKGAKVLLVDTDTQGQVSSALGAMPEVGLAELMVGKATPEEAVTEVRERLWLLAGGREIAGIKREIARKEFGGERTLIDALQPIDEIYDYVILDTSPGWDAMTVNVLFYAREILAPVSLEAMTLKGLLEFQRSVEAIQRYDSDLSFRYVLPTFMDGRVRKSAEILAQIHAHYGGLVCPPIRYNVRLSEAPGFGQTIFEYASGSTGAEDYRRVTERVADGDS